MNGVSEPAAWRIDVVDHGIGISPDDQQRIFAEFEQVSMRVAHATGTGLGLALARHFVEAHGGRSRSRARSARGYFFGEIAQNCCRS